MRGEQVWFFGSSEIQMVNLEPYSQSHGRPRVDDRPGFIRMIYVNCDSLIFLNVPLEYTPKRLYNRYEL